MKFIVSVAAIILAPVALLGFTLFLTAIVLMWPMGKCLVYLYDREIT